MKKKLFILMGIILIIGLVTATVTQLTFNSPGDGAVISDNSQLLNITAYNNDDSKSMEVKIYGSNNSVVQNNSLIYVQSNVTNASEITYNWTSPKLKTTDDPNIVLLMYFDNQTDEGNWSEIPVDDNMVTYFKFNNDSSVGESYTGTENEVVYDYSNAKKNGTTFESGGNVGDGPTFISNGRFNGAFDFDGLNDAVDIADNTAEDPLDVTDGITIELWVNPDVFGNGDDLVNKNNAYSLTLGTSGPWDGILWRVYVDGAFRSLGTGAGILKAGTWQHVAVIYNSSSKEQTIYINGQKSATTTLTGLTDYNISTNNNDLYVGGTNYFDGKLDQVLIYNRSLSMDEIREHANTKLIDETGINNGTRHKYTENLFNYSGKLGSSLTFDDNEYVSINSSDSLNLTQNFSISFWAYPTDLTKNQTFLAKGSGTTTNYYIDFKETDDNKIEFGFYNGDWRSVSVNASIFAVNQWNLITVTRNSDSNVSSVYINGINKGSLQLDYSLLANSNDLKLGYFPGYNQNYTGLLDELIIYNKTLTSTEVTNIHQLKSGTWYWKFSAEDGGGLNMSTTRSFIIGSVWTVSPTDLGSVGSALNTNVSVGILTINNTHANKNVTINITSDYTGVVTFNKTVPFNLSGSEGNWTEIQINVTSPATAGSTTINFNITATDYSRADSVPPFIIVPVTLVSTSDQPFLITAFETYPTSVSQNNTGISLKASVVNRGQGNAGSVSLTFELPNGWSNSSGDLTQNLGVLTVNEQKNASITANVNSTATAGTVILYANVSGQNSSGWDLNSSYITVGDVSVIVNEVSTGGGPSSLPVTPSAPSGGGGGGGGGRATEVVYDKIIEILREEEAVFDIEVYNKYLNSSLEDLTLELIGYPEQYVTILPIKIDKINYKETKNFTIRIKIPAYEGHEEYALKAIIKGNFIKGMSKTDYKETQNIKLIILATPLEEAEASLEEARRAVENMKAEGFNTIFVEKLLAEAELNIAEGRNKKAQDLAIEIIETKNLAFDADDLINKIKRVIANPKLIGLITGNIVKESKSMNSKLTGNAILKTQDIDEVLTLAVIAFERGDYRTALERAQLSRVLLVLESRGNVTLFLFLYWPFILLGVLIFSITGVTGYRTYQKNFITKKIEDINLEEESIQKLIADAQLKYFNKKINRVDYNQLVKRHTLRESGLQKQKIRLRNKRLKLLKPQQIFQALQIETNEVENKIKKLQFDYFRDKKISKYEYGTKFKDLNGLLAEVEGERATLQLIKAKKEKGIKIKPKIKQKEVKKLEEEIEKRGKIRIFFLKILGSYKRLKENIIDKIKLKKEQNYKDVPEKEFFEKVKDKKSNQEVGERDKEQKLMLLKYNAKKKVSGIYNSVKEFSNKIIRKIKHGSGKQGVVMVDNMIMEKLKEKVDGMNLKGKWINIGFEEPEKEDKNEK